MALYRCKLLLRLNRDAGSSQSTICLCDRSPYEAGTWIAGAHLGWPGIGRVVRKGEAYGYEPAA